MLAQMTVQELQGAMHHGVRAGATQKPLSIIDVRESCEFKDAHIDGAEHIPLANLAREMRLKHPDKEAPILVYCDIGIRSNHAAKLLRALGYQRVMDLRGGIHAYQHDLSIRRQAPIDKRMIS
jgi:phage shock protein E